MTKTTTPPKAKFGKMLPSGDRMTNVDCPNRFCGGKIVYNGNYFCQHFGDTCNFALQGEEYEQDINGQAIRTIPAPPLHQRMLKAIQLDVFGKVLEPDA